MSHTCNSVWPGGQQRTDARVAHGLVPRPRIQVVADDRMAGGSEVNPYLVSSAHLRAQLHEADVRNAGELTVPGQRAPAGNTGAGRSELR
jgi:hypothetical protein